MRAPRLVSSALTALSVAAWLCSSAVADAAPKKKQGSGQKSKKGKGKGGSMDDSAGQSDGGLAPGSDDAKAKAPPAPPPEAKKDSKSADKSGKEAAPAEPDPPSEPPAEAPAAEAAAPAEPEPEPAPAEPKIRKNWFTLGVQQEALFYARTSGVCDSAEDGRDGGEQYPGHPQYSCRDGNGLYDDNVYSDAGNELQGGFGLATTRILVGYDRVFIDRLTIGGRIGYAFGGTPTVVGGGTFNPLHAELKSAFFFGDKPFERMSFRPYASLGVGIGEVDGKVSVDFYADEEGYQDGEVGRLDAWRQTGVAFGALGLGVGYPVGPLMPTLELRGLMMFGEPAFAMALAGNIAYGI